MDNTVLVDELKKVLNAVRREKGHIALFMITWTDAGSSDAWSIIVSTTGYDTLTIKDAVTHLVHLVIENVSAEHVRHLIRATVLKTGDPFVRAVNQAFAVRNSTTRIQSHTIAGIFIESAILLESQSPSEKSGGGKTRKVAQK